MPKRAASGSPTAEDAPATKKARTSETTVDKILNLSEASLKALKKDALVENIVALQTTWFNFQAQNAHVTTSQASSTAIMEPAKIKEKANKASNMMYNGIKKQMKWQPSCKTSGKKWSYEGAVALPEIRYGSLRITSEDIMLKWNKEDNSFSVSGRYGL